MIPVYTGALSNGKIGALLGIYISIYLAYRQIAKNPSLNTSYHFVSSENNFFSTILMKKWITWSLITIVIVGFTLEFVFQSILQYYGTFLFIITSLITYYYGKRYQAFDFGDHFKDNLRNNYRKGMLLIAAGIFLIWYNVYPIWGLLFITGGISFIQYVTTKQGSDLQESFIKYFSFPSVTVLVAGLVISLIISTKGTSWDISLMPKFESIIYVQSKEDEGKIRFDIQKLFEDLKAQHDLYREIEPVVDIKLSTIKRLNLKTEVNLEGNFTYNYADNFSDTIRHYRDGRYRLKESDIAMAIVQAFKLSVDNYLSNFFEEGTDILINLEGAADAKPFSEKKKTSYRGEYGNFVEKKVTDANKNRRQRISISSGEQLDNRTLAVLRAEGIRDFIDEKINVLKKAKTDFKYSIFVEETNIGPEFRRVAVGITIYDVYRNF